MILIYTQINNGFHFFSLQVNITIPVNDIHFHQYQKGKHPLRKDVITSATQCMRRVNAHNSTRVLHSFELSGI